MGLLQRHEAKGKSKVRLEVIPSTRRHHLHDRVEKHVEDGAKVYTDALRSYNHLGVYFQHQVIDHAEKYVDGQVHTNGLLVIAQAVPARHLRERRAVHLFRYLDEQSFRFNERSGNDADRFTQTMRQIAGKRVTYTQLTGKEAIA